MIPGGQRAGSPYPINPGSAFRSAPAFQTSLYYEAQGSYRPFYHSPDFLHPCTSQTFLSVAPSFHLLSIIDYHWTDRVYLMILITDPASAIALKDVLDMMTSFPRSSGQSSY